MAFPVKTIDLENAGFETGERGDCGGVAVCKVFPEAAGEAPVETRAECLLVPGSLGREVFEGGNVAVDVVSLFHVKEGKAFLEDSPILRVSEAVPEVVPEQGSGSLEVRSGLL